LGRQKKKVAKRGKTKSDWRLGVGELEGGRCKKGGRPKKWASGKKHNLQGSRLKLGCLRQASAKKGVKGEGCGHCSGGGGKESERERLLTGGGNPYIMKNLPANAKKGAAKNVLKGVRERGKRTGKKNN